MTIMKAIALAALTGTLAFGPQAAFAQSTEHGKAGAAHSTNDSRKSGNVDAKAERTSTRETSRQERQDARQLTKEERKEDAGSLNFGRIIASLRTGGELSEVQDLSGEFEVEVVDLSAYQGRPALENALRDLSEEDLQASLEEDPEISAALDEADVEIDTVVFADVDAEGNLVVFTE